jgi:Helitron helicase-like domain at N-terminus
VCTDCGKYRDTDHFEKKGWLPIWYLDGCPQYHIPDTLSSLTLAEKMLIQLASPFIPLRHIKNGVFGLAGHVCSFEQDVAGFVDTLPRQLGDVTLLEVLKTVRAEIGSDAERIETYKVRRTNVAAALKWLKLYNSEYRNIKIDMSALDWLGGEEGNLDALEVASGAALVTEEDECNDVGVDMGPSAKLTRTTIGAVKQFGYVNDEPSRILSPDDCVVHNEILETVTGSPLKEQINVEWPATGPVAISEYGDTKIFARAFPWLFPGGIGDVNGFTGDINKWGEYLLQYEDGRFAKDKFFTFYALNYITRNRNAGSGNWFIKDFNKKGPSNLEELKATINKGDLRFINRLSYFNKRIKGSSPYWFQKRSEVYTWINHHVEQSNGLPTFFVTLSCGEHYWEDIIRLLRERMKIAKDNYEDCYQGSPKLSQILNDYTIVVQEYFQARVANWIETCGRDIFGITHWWGRFEFAPGRGQIHIHLIGIRKDQSILKLCYNDLQQPNGKMLRAKRLAEWASTHFGLTATVDPTFDTLQIPPGESPCSIKFSSLLPNDPVTIHSDEQRLMSFCQVHDCNGFCLRQRGTKRYVFVCNDWISEVLGNPPDTFPGFYEALGNPPDTSPGFSEVPVIPSVVFPGFTRPSEIHLIHLPGFTRSP